MLRHGGNCLGGRVCSALNMQNTDDSALTITVLPGKVLLWYQFIIIKQSSEGFMTLTGHYSQHKLYCKTHFLFTNFIS